MYQACLVERIETIVDVFDAAVARNEVALDVLRVRSRLRHGPMTPQRGHVISSPRQA